MNKYIKKILFFLEILLNNPFNIEKISLFAKVFPYTMAGYKRLSNAYELASLVHKNDIKGDFAECGVWKGGTAASMAFVAEKLKSGRKTWLFDSFEGLPEPTKEDGDLAKTYSGNRTEGKMESIDKCVGPLEDAKKIFFEILKLNEKNVVIKKGWFRDTLPVSKNEIGKIAILRLDGDWYESTKVCLDNLYDKVASGGYIIIDDYGHWEGAKKATDEFLAKKGIKPDLVKIDYTGVYFIK
ncbi:MAG: TylF/MycF/NovP-related O-methyltransferase [Patescibacteria group bacterium]